MSIKKSFAENVFTENKDWSLNRDLMPFYHVPIKPHLQNLSFPAHHTPPPSPPPSTDNPPLSPPFVCRPCRLWCIIISMVNTKRSAARDAERASSTFTATATQTDADPSDISTAAPSTDEDSRRCRCRCRLYHLCCLCCSFRCCRWHHQT
jgi:hypothetical protein